MSYIRGALPFLIYNPNTRDDIRPDGIRSTFELSQEVPGGYENNVQVIRREFKYEPLIQSCTSIAFDSTANEITCSVPAIAAALSTVNAGDVFKVEGAAEAQNNDNHVVTSVVYDGQIITFTVETELVDEDAGEPITLTRKYAGPWEVIEPIVDYSIAGTGEQANRIITFTKVPKEEDVIYVMHRGEATYNFVPSEKSVGPEQLTENLRNFLVDIFTGDGDTTEFELTQTSVNAKALEVSVDGVIYYGSDIDLQFTGDFQLLSDFKTILFSSPPADGAKIYVRHLGFSTVSRRQFLSPSQLGSVGPKTIGTAEIQNNAVNESIIEDGAVSSSKIRAGAVDGGKILLQNSQWLSWANSTPALPFVNVLRVDPSNATTLKSSGISLLLNVNDARTIQISSDSISDANTSGAVSLGTSTRKFADGHFSGSVNANDVSVTSTLTVGENAQVSGNLAVSGNIAVSGNVDGVDISALQAQVTALAALVAQNTPAGTIKMWANDSGAPSGYVMCDGSVYSTASYPALFAAIGYAFGGSGSSFAVPDFRGQFPLGKATSGTGSGWGSVSGRGGSLDHTHSTPDHKHSLNDHIHSIPSHYHSMGSGGTLAAGKMNKDLTSGAMSANASHSHTASDSGHAHGYTDPGHVHELYARDGALNTFNSTYFPTYTSASSTNDRARYTLKAYTGISISTAYANISIGSANINHTHTVPDHEHPIAGSIGNRTTGQNGDLDFNTGKPSPNNTDTSGAGTTGGSNPAYQTINFIIKT